MIKTTKLPIYIKHLPPTSNLKNYFFVQANIFFVASPRNMNMLRPTPPHTHSHAR